MDRRAFLTGTAGAVGTSFAGCITIGEEPNEHLAWSASLDVSPNPMDARDLAVADGAVAAVTADRLFGVDSTGAVRWTDVEHPTAVVPTGGDFLAVDWPNYHPRNAVNEAMLKRVSPDGSISWRSDRYRLFDLSVGSGRVFVLHERGEEGMALSAVALGDGAERWSVPVDGSTIAVRTTGDAVVTLGADVAGHDPASGETAWTAPAYEDSFPPATDGSRVYLTAEEEPYRVRTLDAADGRTVNEYEVGDGLLPSAPLVVRDGVGLGTGYDGDSAPFFAVDPSTGAVRWWTLPEDEMSLSDSPRSAGAFLDDTAYLFDYRYVLRAVDVSDGSHTWTFDAEKAYPVVDAGSDAVYVLAGGTLYALDPSPR